jgi:hypothetical protein
LWISVTQRAWLGPQHPHDPGEQSGLADAIWPGNYDDIRKPTYSKSLDRQRIQDFYGFNTHLIPFLAQRVGGAPLMW